MKLKIVSATSILIFTFSSVAFGKKVTTKSVEVKPSELVVKKISDISPGEILQVVDPANGMVCLVVNGISYGSSAGTGAAIQCLKKD